MERKIITTSDGSRSLYLPEWDETYHSRHGAVQEAYHVFIRMGLDRFEDRAGLSILEIGFGTGLNAFITLLEAARRNLAIHYHGLEAYPVEQEVIGELDYPASLGVQELAPLFRRLHESPWEAETEITPAFHLFKQKVLFSEFRSSGGFDLVYFDAFGPRVQPELWTPAIFGNMHEALRPGGILVTYSAKGSVRRAMQEVGFSVERLPGPPGKREMLRATKASE